jgi:hypothetical protein
MTMCSLLHVGCTVHWFMFRPHKHLEPARRGYCGTADPDVKDIVNLWAGGSAAVKSMLGRH